MSSPNGSPDRKLMITRPLDLQTETVGSVNLAFTQEEDSKGQTMLHDLCSPMSVDSFPQSPDGSLYSERSQAHLLTGGRSNSKRALPNASFSINMAKDDVLEKNASVTSQGPLTATGDEVPEEKLKSVALQMIGPFLTAGFGTVAAGLLLDSVQDWPNYKNIPELLGLVPTLLGLKGNLEMTLTARLCTAANMGNMDTRKDQWRHIAGNLCVTQCQATAVSFLASIISIIVYIISENNFNIQNTFVLCASALLTASTASCLLGMLMCSIVVLSRKFNLNPDNVAAPIAASLGDITTLALLSYSSYWLYTFRDVVWLAPTIVFLFLAVAPVWAYVSYRNPSVRYVVLTGWTPVIGAMTISMGAGYILEKAVNVFKSMAVYQPVIAGVGGNLVVVQTCRMTTFLGRRSQLGTHPEDDNRSCLDPISALFGSHYLSRTARLLLLVTVPGHLIFVYAIQLFSGEESGKVTPLFLALYLLGTITQVGLLLYMARCMVYYMWKRAIDPDNAAIPYLTALGDLIGIGLLALVFVILNAVHDKSVVLNHAEVN